MQHVALPDNTVTQVSDAAIKYYTDADLVSVNHLNSYERLECVREHLGQCLDAVKDLTFDSPHDGRLYVLADVAIRLERVLDISHTVDTIGGAR